MKVAMRVMMAVLLTALVGVLGAQGPVGGNQGAATRDAALDRAARFVVCDVMVESGAEGLGAWQVECVGKVRGEGGGSVELVGVEGGEAGVYETPAFYDPEALSHERVVIGAFSLEKGEKLPRGRTRVARLHLRVVGGEAGAGKQNVEMSVKVMAAADGAGKAIDVTASGKIEETP